MQTEDQVRCRAWRRLIVACVMVSMALACTIDPDDNWADDIGDASDGSEDEASDAASQSDPDVTPEPDEADTSADPGDLSADLDDDGQDLEDASSADTAEDGAID